MKRGDQKAGCNPNRFVDVIIFHAPSIRKFAVVLSEDGDQIGSCVKKWFMFVRAEWGKGIQPFLRRAAMIELPFFIFSRDPDLVLDLAIANDNKVPGL